MTLPLGQISLGQVNTELNLSATTQISLNQANVRALAGVPSGQIAMSNLQGKSGVTYWIAFLSSHSNNMAGSRGSADSNGVTAMFVSSGGPYAIRLNTVGAISSSARLSTTSYMVNGNNYPVQNGPTQATLATAANSDGSTVYGVGYATPSSQFNICLLSTNASGSQNYFSRLYRAGYTVTAQSLIVGSDGYLYQGGYIDDGGGVPRQLITRYSSGGTIQWTKRLTDNTGGGGAIGDGTNLYVFTTYRTGTTQRGYLLKYDISATTKTYSIQYLPSASNTTNQTAFRSAVLYGGYLYVVGSVNEVTGLQGLGLVAAIWKINPADGAIVWQYYVRQNNQSNTGLDVHVGADGYLYFTSQNNVSFTQSITKLDVNASVSWQRVLSVSGTSSELDRPMNVSTVSTIMYLSTANGNAGYSIVLKLPTDGTKTGSYAGPSGTTYTYASFSSWGSLGGDVVASANNVNFADPPAATETTSGNTSGSAGTTVTLLTSV